MQHGITHRTARSTPRGAWRAPLGLGPFGGAILVGNFGDGRINAFGNRGEFLGQLRARTGKPITIDGLWALKFGGFQGADPEDLYFTPGPRDEKNGLIGEVSGGRRPALSAGPRAGQPRSRQAAERDDVAIRR